MKPGVLALSGGVGGAKLALGLEHVLAPDELLIVANTGDDFEHLGYSICPDIDTLLYTLGGVSNPATGWGRANETWSFMESLHTREPEQAWFRLGDKDLETHRYRTTALAAGATLTEVTAALAHSFRIAPAIAPMSDEPVRTFVLVEGDAGQEWLPFQEYFVQRQCQPRIIRLDYRGSQEACVSSGLRAYLENHRVEAVVLCPSNPFLSIDPILAVPGLVDLLHACQAPVVAVSPVVGGQALKGPTAKIMRELDLQTTNTAIAEHYQGLIHGLVIDHQDQAEVERIREQGVEVAVTSTVMTTLEDRQQLARDVLAFASRIARL